MAGDAAGGGGAGGGGGGAAASRGFRETSWFVEGARQSEAHERAATTGEELPEEIRSLEEKYAPGGVSAAEEKAFSLHTGKTGKQPAFSSETSGPVGRSRRDSTHAIKAVVRTPAGRFFRALLFTLLAALLLGAAVVGLAFARLPLPPAFATPLEDLRTAIETRVLRRPAPRAPQPAAAPPAAAPPPR